MLVGRRIYLREQNLSLSNKNASEINRGQTGTVYFDTGLVTVFLGGHIPHCSIMLNPDPSLKKKHCTNIAGFSFVQYENMEHKLLYISTFVVMPNPQPQNLSQPVGCGDGMWYASKNPTQIDLYHLDPSLPFKGLLSSAKLEGTWKL